MALNEVTEDASWSRKGLDRLVRGPDVHRCAERGVLDERQLRRREKRLGSRCRRPASSIRGHRFGCRLGRGHLGVRCVDWRSASGAASWFGPDNRRDLVIRNDGSFRWGTWFGHVDGSGTEFALFIARPAGLRQRFDDFGASVSIPIVGRRMQIWLPDLGQDRDVDFGDAVEDIDSPDMEFRRVRG